MLVTPLCSPLGLAVGRPEEYRTMSSALVVDRTLTSAGPSGNATLWNDRSGAQCPILPARRMLTRGSSLPLLDQVAASALHGVSVEVWVAETMLLVRSALEVSCLWPISKLLKNRPNAPPSGASR